MAELEHPLERLRGAIESLAAGDAAGLVAEARAEARGRVKTALTELFTDVLLEGVGRELRAAARVRPVAEEAPVAPPVTQTGSGPTQTASGPTQTASDRTRTASDSTQTAIYVYGVIAADDAELPVAHEGIVAGAVVKHLVEGRIAAVSTEVPVSEFGEDELRSRLADMTWVERVARAHEAVLDELCRRGTVVPMRMCTVYLSERSVREMLRRESARLEDALIELDGKIEWGVKVLAEEGPPSTTAQRRAAADAAEQAESGTDYLARRREQRDQLGDQDLRLQQAAADVHEALLGVAVEGLLTPLQSGLAAEHPISNGVYLVQRTRTGAFHREVDRLRIDVRKLGLQLLETGPWPPYNFVPETLW